MANSKLAQKGLAILNQKSESALAILRKTVLEEKFGIETVDKAIEQYISKYCDTSRPGMLAIACEAVGGKVADVVPLQVALSFIDATMDIHDDLIDESVMKKNTRTIYGKLGKETALLIGDNFMVKGFCYLHQSIEKLPTEQQKLIVEECQCFLAEVVGAHILETKLKRKKWTTTPEIYLQVLYGKAADIEGRMRIGAIYSGGSKKEIDALGKYGRDIGILLSIRAEYVDIFEPEELLDRAQHGCLPLQILYPLSEKRYRKRIRELLSKESLNKKDSDEVLDMIEHTKTSSMLRIYIECREKEAIKSIADLNNSQAKKGLKLIATSMLEDM